MRGKKGLASGIIAVIVVLFLFGLFSLLAITGWNQFNNTIQGLENSTVSQEVKDNIDELGDFTGWADRLFILVFVALLVGYIVTSFTLTTDKTIFIVLFFIFLIFSSIIAMIFSNGWAYLIANANFVSAASELPFTTWFMTYLPLITFFMGLIGGIIFYARKRTAAPVSDSFNVDFENQGGGGGGEL